MKKLIFYSFLFILVIESMFSCKENIQSISDLESIEIAKKIDYLFNDNPYDDIDILYLTEYNKELGKGYYSHVDRIVKQTKSSGNNSFSKEILLFESGKLISESKVKSDSISEKTEYSFKGDNILKINYVEDGHINPMHSVEFHYHNERVHKIIEGGRLTLEIEYPNPNLMVITYANEALGIKDSLFLDDYGKLKSSVNLHKNGERWFSDFSYNGNSLTNTSIVFKTWNGVKLVEEKSHSIDFSYNDFGWLSRSVSMVNENEKENILRTYKFFRNSKNQVFLVLEKTIRNSPIKQEWIFDEHWNWIDQKYYRAGDLLFHEKREISYRK